MNVGDSRIWMIAETPIRYCWVNCVFIPMPPLWYKKCFMLVPDPYIIVLQCEADWWTPKTQKSDQTYRGECEEPVKKKKTAPQVDGSKEWSEINSSI